MDIDHVFLNHIVLTGSLQQQERLINAPAEELIRPEVGGDLKLNDVFSLSNLVCSDSQHASILSVPDLLASFATRQRKSLFKLLVRGFHQFTHVESHFTDCVL